MSRVRTIKGAAVKIEHFPIHFQFESLHSYSLHPKLLRRLRPAQRFGHWLLLHLSEILHQHKHSKLYNPMSHNASRYVNYVG